jgi:hypothetical protein
MPVDEGLNDEEKSHYARLKRRAEHAGNFDNLPYAVAILLQLSEGQSAEALSASRILRSFTHGETCVLRDDYPRLPAHGRNALSVILRHLNKPDCRIEDIRKAFDHPVPPPPPFLE